MGRSGTTLVEGLMAARPGFFAVGEMVYLWERGLRANERCSCGANFNDCPFWTAALADAFGDTLDQWLPRLAGAHRGFMGRVGARHGDTQRNAVLEAQRRVYASAAKLSGAAVIIDSSKFPAYGNALLAAPDLDVRVVHVVRDSRAVAHSWQRRKRRTEVDDANAFMPVFAVRKIAIDWVRMNRESGSLQRAAIHGVRLRYEDLACSSNVVSQSLDGLGLEPMDNPAKPFGERHSVSGNPSRLDTTPTTVRIDDAWVTEMPRRSRAAVTALTAPWLVRYGYRLRSGARD